MTGAEQPPVHPELSEDVVSDGGLEIMRDHLSEAYDRLGRAADRSDELDLTEIGNGEHAPSFKLSGAAAYIDETVRQIDGELERRGVE